MRLAVILATRGRPELVSALLKRLQNQVRCPDKIYISATGVDDLPKTDDIRLDIEVMIGDAGLTKQRNRGLIEAEKSFDLIVFFDDDYVPSISWLAYAEQFFSNHRDVVGVMGRTIADGAYGPGLSLSEATALLEAAEPVEPTGAWILDKCLYGCNMAYRVSGVCGQRFDEALPSYGWLEDRDFSYRAQKFGSVVRALDLVGVHMGTKGARTSGRRLGFSQVVNPIYLARIGSIPFWMGCGLLLRAFLKNAIKSLFPEYYIDRRGRLFGNLAGLFHLASGKCDPAKMEQL